MQEYRVEWQKYPWNYNDPRVVFVQARSADEAKLVAIDKIERTTGLAASAISINDDQLARTP
jgi:gamma-glutamylcyclotransferase (GGCT)/AIG2-like uncharacterized protein YtfP